MTPHPTAAEIAGRLNLPRSRRGYRGKCPVCANDALECRSIEGRLRLTCYYGCDPAELHRAAGGEQMPVLSIMPRQPPQERVQAALGVWRGAADAHPSLAAYCAFRGLPGLERSPSLRWRADVRHPEKDGLHPAMVALVQDVEGEPIGVHRTFTRRDGHGKADLNPTKASKGVVAGGAIRMDEAADELLIGEGVETSAAAGRMMGLPAWSAVSAGNLARTLQLPGSVRRVVIASDNDPAGQRAADEAAARWTSEGRRVRVIAPDRPGQDFADLHAARHRGH